MRRLTTIYRFRTAVNAVSHYLKLTGVLGYMRRLKSKGVRLDRMVVAMCVFTMYASNSLNACAEWLSDPAVRKCLGFKIGEGITLALWDGLNPHWAPLA